MAVAADASDDVRTSFERPTHPGLSKWMSWCAAQAGQFWSLDGAVLEGVRTVDSESLLAAMEGYRFVADHPAGSSGDVVWRDASDDGDWPEEWLVLQVAAETAIIGDLSSVQLPVLAAAHGQGKWAAVPLFPSVDELIEAITVATAPTRESVEIRLVSLYLLDLGPHPLRTLTALRELPEFRGLSPKELLGLRDRLPLALVVECQVEFPLSRTEHLLRPYGVSLERLTKVVAE